jgi:hypothetical protein
MSAPKDPADYRPRPLLGITFWAMLALMLLCVLAGLAVANYGPRLFSPKPGVKAAAQDVSIAEASAASSPVSIALTAPVVSASQGAPSLELSRLSARVATLEAQQTHASQAAAASSGGGTAPLPEGWTEHFSKSKQLPYYKASDGTTTWHRPV